MTYSYNYITIINSGGGQMRYLNHWANIMIGVFGGIIIANLFRLSDISIFPQLPESVFLWLSIIILLIGIFLLVFKYYIRKEKPRLKEDERESAISDRSARNGLLATYFTLFILLAIDIPPDAKSLLMVIAAGLFVFLISSIFYYYKKA
jgi:predicted histidine transporter YuiF (NhaC family)